MIYKEHKNTITTANKIQQKFFTSGLNYQAVLATYYTGSTVGNLHFIYSSLGLDNLNNWEYVHFKNCEEGQDKILTLTEEIVSRALVSEIVKTMEVKYHLTNKQVNDIFQTIKRRRKIHLQLESIYPLTWGGKIEAVAAHMIRGRATPS